VINSETSINFNKIWYATFWRKHVKIVKFRPSRLKSVTTLPYLFKYLTLLGRHVSAEHRGLQWAQ